jgi:hypothetical protein
VSMATQKAVGPEPAEAPEVHPTHEEIAALANTLWQQRGCPHGSPDEDWFRAEAELTGPHRRGVSLKWFMSIWDRIDMEQDLATNLR